LPKHMKPYEAVGGKLLSSFIFRKVKLRVISMFWTSVLVETASLGK